MSGGESPNADQTPPVFSQEQKAWLDQFLTARMGRNATSTTTTDGPTPTRTPGNVGLGVTPPAAALPDVPTFEGGDITAPIISTGADNTPTTPQQITLLGMSLPAKLQKKILDLEFIEMSELLPNTWRLQDEDTKCCQARKSLRRGPVNDILVWTECYSTLVAVLSSRFPKQTPQLMAYQRTIVRAQRTFVGEGWIVYDTCYRRKAAVSKSLNWGDIDFTLYNETFMGRAKALARC